MSIVRYHRPMGMMQQGLLITLAASVAADTNVRRPVLVFGGAGRLGASIIRLLVDADYRVTVFVRPTTDLGRLAGLEVAFVTGELMDAASVAHALQGRRYYCVIDATSRGTSRDMFFDTAMRNILHAVSAGNVDQFILHGSIGAGDNIKHFPDFKSGRMRDLLVAKGNAETMLKDSGFGYTIIRSGMIDVDGTPATGTARLTENDSAIGRITRLDLAALTIRCLGQSDCMNKVFHAVDDDR